MKRDVVKFIALCDTWQRVKAEHQRPTGLLQPHEYQVEVGRDCYGVRCEIAEDLV
jgi:hypothetical protein